MTGHATDTRATRQTRGHYRYSSPHHPTYATRGSFWPAVVLVAVAVVLLVWVAGLVRVAADEYREIGQQIGQQTDTYKQEG